MTNLAFTALIKSKGYNKQRLADVCGLSKTQMSNRINGANDWRWPEVGKAYYKRVRRRCENGR